MPIRFPLPLPEFLADSDGQIRITGHRISLYDVLAEYNLGHTAEEIAVRFPTLKRATVHKLIAYYLDNTGAIDAYLTAYTQALDEKRSRAQPTISVAELECRLENIRRKAHNAAQIAY